MSKLYLFLIGRKDLATSLFLKIQFPFKDSQLQKQIADRIPLFVMTSDPDVKTTASNVYVCVISICGPCPLSKFYLATDRFTDLQNNQVVNVKFMRTPNITLFTHIPQSQVPRIRPSLPVKSTGTQTAIVISEIPVLSSRLKLECVINDFGDLFELVISPTIIPLLFRTIQLTFSTVHRSFEVTDFNQVLSRTIRDVQNETSQLNIPEINQNMNFNDIPRAWLLIHPDSQFKDILYGKHKFCHLHFCLIKWTQMILSFSLHSSFSETCVTLLFRILNERTPTSTNFEILETYKDLITDPVVGNLISDFCTNLSDQSTSDLEFHLNLSSNTAFHKTICDSYTTPVSLAEYADLCPSNRD